MVSLHQVLFLRRFLAIAAADDIGWDWDATVLRVHHALYAGTREREGREALRQFLANCLHTMIPQIDIGVAEGNGRHRAHFPVRAVAVFTPTTLLKNLAMRGAFVIQFLSRTPGGDASMHAGATYKDSIYSNLTLCIAALFYHYFSAPAECGLPLALETLRYSVTFRTLREAVQRRRAERRERRALPQP